ncbi:MAG: hypothetical protein KGI58_04100 [Patescibacteria group bacterium]|nr:hypothetical protein [Patescibacteria group bacterium]
MAYNPELVEQLLGKEVSKLFDGTIKIEPYKGELFSNLKVDDKLTFSLKDNTRFRQLK